MKKFDKKTQIKILKIILIVAWMLIVFSFSNQGGTKSSNTSRKVTVTVVQIISDKPIEENEQLIEKVDKVIRKLAHYTIYTIGGFLIMNYAYTTDRSKKEKILYSMAFGAGYAVTDELHQFFVAGRSARIFDIGIDTLGVATGILIYLIIRKIIDIAIIKYKRQSCNSLQNFVKAKLIGTKVEFKGENKSEY